MGKPQIIAQVLAYNEATCLKAAVTPWIPFCKRIDILEGAFFNLSNLGFSQRSNDGTLEIAKELEKDNPLVIRAEVHMFANEPILRNHNLWDTAKVFGREDTVLFILDADEIYSEDDIKKCVAQIESEWETHNTWWVNFKNYVNDENTYYLGFRVPRFFKMKNARGFSGYNDVCFSDGVKQTDINGVLPKHYSWLPIEKSMRKLSWQKAIGWEPSWLVDGKKLILNDDYYGRTGKDKPILLSETH